MIGVYWETWSDWKSNLKDINDKITVVYISFADPRGSYKTRQNFTGTGDVMMQAVLGGVASTTGTAMTATNEMLQDVLNAIADRGGMLTASAIGFLTTVFTIVQLASLNSNQRRIGQGRVREAVRQIEQRPQMRQIADVAANTGRGMIEGAVRSYRNA